MNNLINTDFKNYLVGLIAIINCLSSITPFLSISKNLEKKTVIQLAALSTLGSFIIMIATMFFGTKILNFFGISISAFQIAGGMILLKIGNNMLNSNDTSFDDKGEQITEHKMDRSYIVSNVIIPIAMPLTVGAGGMSAITLLADIAQKNNTMWSLFYAICVIAASIFFTLYFANDLMKILGTIGMNVMTKIMGLFILSIGIQFIITAISTVYCSLR